MLLFEQTDPAWEYWDDSTYFATAITVVATLAAGLVLRYRRKAKAQDDRRTN